MTQTPTPDDSTTQAVIEHYCGGFRCGQPATIEVLAGKTGGMLGWICEDHAEEIEREWELNAARNREDYGDD